MPMIFKFALGLLLCTPGLSFGMNSRCSDSLNSAEQGTIAAEPPVRGEIDLWRIKASMNLKKADLFMSTADTSVTDSGACGQVSAFNAIQLALAHEGLESMTKAELNGFAQSLKGKAGGLALSDLNKYLDLIYHLMPTKLKSRNPKISGTILRGERHTSDPRIIAVDQLTTKDLELKDNQIKIIFIYYPHEEQGHAVIQVSFLATSNWLIYSDPVSRNDAAIAVLSNWNTYNGSITPGFDFEPQKSTMQRPFIPLAYATIELKPRTPLPL